MGFRTNFSLLLNLLLTVYGCLSNIAQRLFNGDADNNNTDSDLHVKVLSPCRMIIVGFDAHFMENDLL